MLVDVSLANLARCRSVEGQDEVRVLLKALLPIVTAQRPCPLEEQRRASTGTPAASLANLRDRRRPGPTFSGPNMPCKTR